MTHSLEDLESVREKLRRELFEIGDFRPGTVYPSYRKCGKKNCACAKPGHPGHLQYLRTTAKGGKNRAQTLRLGPELEKAVKEAESYQHFVKVCRELVSVNERISKLRPARQVKSPENNAKGSCTTLEGTLGGVRAPFAALSGPRSKGWTVQGGQRKSRSEAAGTVPSTYRVDSPRLDGG